MTANERDSGVAVVNGDLKGMSKRSELIPFRSTPVIVVGNCLGLLLARGRGWVIIG